jgi:hypothetical protein
MLFRFVSFFFFLVVEPTGKFFGRRYRLVPGGSVKFSVDFSRICSGPGQGYKLFMRSVY